jgi:hypothetical protein
VGGDATGAAAAERELDATKPPGRPNGFVEQRVGARRQLSGSTAMTFASQEQ